MNGARDTKPAATEPADRGQEPDVLNLDAWHPDVWHPDVWHPDVWHLGVLNRGISDRFAWLEALSAVHPCDCADLTAYHHALETGAARCCAPLDAAGRPIKPRHTKAN